MLRHGESGLLLKDERRWSDAEIISIKRTNLAVNVQPLAAIYSIDLA